MPVADEKPVLLAQALRKAYGTQATAKAAHDLGTAPGINQWTHSHAEPPTPQPGKVIDFTARRARRDG